MKITSKLVIQTFAFLVGSGIAYDMAWRGTCVALAVASGLSAIILFSWAAAGGVDEDRES